MPAILDDPEFSEDSYDENDLVESQSKDIPWSDIEQKNNQGCSRKLLENTNARRWLTYFKQNI